MLRFVESVVLVGFPPADGKGPGAAMLAGPVGCAIGLNRAPPASRAAVGEPGRAPGAAAPGEPRA